MITTAKLFMHCSRQAARLPKMFRFSDTEARVGKFGNKLVLEPIEAPRLDVAAWRARLDALGAVEFLAEGPPADPPTRFEGPRTGA
jgi:antitoxin VapB